MGYDAELFDNKSICEEATCAICQDVAEEPTTACKSSHPFCKECLNRVRNGPSQKKLCPTCREQLSLEDSALTPIKNIVLRATVRCKTTLECGTKEQGCTWKGLLCDAKKHLAAECRFETDRCSHQGCTQKRKRRDMQRHESQCKFRIMVCEECGDPMLQKDLSNHLKNDCPAVLIACPNECDLGELRRKDMDEHKAIVCKRQKVPCYYSCYGCSHEPERQFLEIHLQEATDLHLACMESKLRKTNKKLQASRKFVADCKDLLKKLTECKNEKVFLKQILEQEELNKASLQAKLQKLEEQSKQTLEQKVDMAKRLTESENEKVRILEQEKLNKASLQAKLQKLEEQLKQTLEQKADMDKRLTESENEKVCLKQILEQEKLNKASLQAQLQKLEEQLKQTLEQKVDMDKRLTESENEKVRILEQEKLNKTSLQAKLQKLEEQLKQTLEQKVDMDKRLTEYENVKKGLMALKQTLEQQKLNDSGKTGVKRQRNDFEEQPGFSLRSCMHKFFTK